jgi:hypothetical protein
VTDVDDEDCGLPPHRLSEALCRLVADPERVEALHALLGPFCHRSRNILNTMKMSLYLARQKETAPGGVESLWAEIDERYQAVEAFFDRLQMLWRPLPEGLVRISLSLLLEDRRSAWVALFAAHDRVLRMTSDSEEDVGDFEPNCLGAALDAFVAWRAGADDPGAGREARLHWRARKGRFEVEWEESPGQGQGPARVRGTTGSTEGRPQPLVLPLLGRVMAAHGGVMEVLAPSGCQLRLSWPRRARVAPNTTP